MSCVATTLPAAHFHFTDGHPLDGLVSAQACDGRHCHGYSDDDEGSHCDSFEWFSVALALVVSLNPILLATALVTHYRHTVDRHFIEGAAEQTCDWSDEDELMRR